MPTDTTLQALRGVRPRNQPGFEEWIEQLDALRTQISGTPIPVRRRLPQLAARHRVVGLSAAAGTALAAVAIVAALTLTATSLPSAYAAAKRALVATQAVGSGTMTADVSGAGSSYTLDTIRWNGDAIALTPGRRSQIGPKYRALLLIDGGAYVERADGSWLRYTTVSDLGPRLSPAAQLAQDDVAGNTADQVLSLATRLTRISQPDGTTVYTGTIPNSSADPSVLPTDDTILRILSNLRSGNEPGAPAGFHGDLRFQMTVGSNGFVQLVSLTFRQHDTGTPSGDGTYTWAVRYSRLGTTAPITAPASFAPAGSGAAVAPTTARATRTVG